MARLGRKLIAASWVGGGLGRRALGEGWPWGPQAGKPRAVGRPDAGRGGELGEAGCWKGQTESTMCKALASLDTILRKLKLSLTSEWQTLVGECGLSRPEHRCDTLFLQTHGQER